MANVKQQLASVREVVPQRKKEDILLVLQHFDNDVPKTIQAFMEEGAEAVLKEWNIPNKRKTNSNKNKKKRGKQQQSASQEDGSAMANGLQEEHIPDNNNIVKPIEAVSTQPTKPAVANDVKPAQHQSAPKAVDSAPKAVNSPKPQRSPRQTNSDRKPASAQSQPRGSPTGATQIKPQEPRQHPEPAQSQPKGSSTGAAQNKPQEPRQRPEHPQSQPKGSSTGAAQNKPQEPRQRPEHPQSQPKGSSTGAAQNKPQEPRQRPEHPQSQPKGSSTRAAQNKPQEPRQRPVHAQSPKGQHPKDAAKASSGQQHGHKQTSGPTAPDRTTGKDAGSGQRSGQGQSSEGVAKRERNVSECSSVTDPSRSKKTGSSLEKSSKDLQRTEVSLTRHKNLLAEEIEKAEKRLRKSLDDARASLGLREEELMRQIQEVKRHATSLLDDRQHRAFELRQDINRAAIKTDSEMLGLRADIKHFVSERKIDEEIGRSSRFTGNPDVLHEAVKNFGEVLPVKSLYTARRPSLTSLTSMDSLSRPTSISEGLLSRSASTVETPATPTSPTTPDADMDSEVAKMAAKMQRSLQGQRGRGPRNQRQGSDRQGQQSSNPRQGPSQSAKDGSRQEQRSNKGNKNNLRNADDKWHQHEASQEGRWNDRPRNDRPRNDRQRNERSEGGRGKDREEPRNKDRVIRRREQYRYRHDQDEVKPDAAVDKNANNESGAVPRPDSIQIPQNEPTVHANKKLEGAVNGDLPASHSSSHDSNANEPKLQEKMQVRSGDQTKADLNVPLVNGNSSSSAESTPTEALPQRKPREDRNRKRVKEVVKEVKSMNGVTNGQLAPVILNGGS